MPIWLAHRAWNLFCDPRGDCLGRCGAFLSCDFGLPRTGSSSAVQFGSLDSLHSSSGTFSSSAWALGLISNGPESLDPWPQNSPSKSCCSDPQTGRRILTLSGPYHGRLSLVSLWVPGFLRLPMTHCWRFGV